MKESLNVVVNIASWYKDGKEKNPVHLLDASRKLSSHLVTLETHRAEYHDKFQTIIFNMTKDGTSVARSENQAHVEVPELYMLRRVMDSSYRMLDVMRTHISYLKTEMQHGT